MYNPQSWNGYAYVGNNPLNRVDPSGTCDVVIGGVMQAPDSAKTAVQQEFADEIGAILVFPYANGSLRAGMSAILNQSANNVSPETQSVITALTAAAGDGQPINVFAFSGGATALTTAIAHLPWDVKGLINNIAYVSPGAMGDLATSPTGGNIGLVRTTGLLDLAIIGSVPSLISPSNIFTASCYPFGHNANCEFSQASAFLSRFAGKPCTQTTGTFANYQAHPPSKGTATSTVRYNYNSGPVGGRPPYFGGLGRSSFDWLSGFSPASNTAEPTITESLGP
jgi:hypothetical protein